MRSDEVTADGPPSAVGNDALPPQSTTTHSATDIPLHVQFATASSGIGIVRGEKNW